jgi:hypothetical protein
MAWPTTRTASPLRAWVPISAMSTMMGCVGAQRNVSGLDECALFGGEKRERQVHQELAPVDGRSVFPPPVFADARCRHCEAARAVLAPDQSRPDTIRRGCFDHALHAFNLAERRDSSKRQPLAGQRKADRVMLVQCLQRRIPCATTGRNWLPIVPPICTCRRPPLRSTELYSWAIQSRSAGAGTAASFREALISTVESRGKLHPRCLGAAGPT